MMGFFRFFVLIVCVTKSVSCHHHHHVHVEDKEENVVDHVKRYAARNEENVVLPEEKNKKIQIGDEVKATVPFSEKRLEKMLEKAILKIITGDLSTGDMLLLKSLNYSLEEVLAIRERELNKKKDEEIRKKEGVKSSSKEKKSKYWVHSSKKLEDAKIRENKKNRHVEKPVYKDFDFEAYNRQAILDYENLPTNLEFQPSSSEYVEYEKTTRAFKEDDDEMNNLHRDLTRALEPHVVFKIRYDDSEFDSSSGSDETANRVKLSKHQIARHTTSKSTAEPFHTTPSVPSTTVTAVPLVYQLSTNIRNKYSNDYSSTTMSSASTTTVDTETTAVDEIPRDENGTNITVPETNSTEGTDMSKSEEKISGNRRTEYEGLEWVEDDVYRVIPQFADSLGFENTEETSDSYEDSNQNSSLTWDVEENENDTSEYQNDPTDSVKFVNASASNLPLANLSTYVQMAIAHRRGQGEKAIEDIKSRVLALTGRFNHSTNANQVQRERLTMFSPTCQIPRNTDQDAWADPYSMNMHFQLNLTSGDHVVAAKLRLFKLPQENSTSSSESTFDEDEEDEKKIRISVYYYTKSLKRHRSKKRLMDSVVTPLTSWGTHLAMDVRQGLRFWKLNPRNPHGNGSNHGLVVQVEDQDGRPLKPALYIQQPSCGEQDSDQKAYERIPALFVRACARYVRIVNGRTETFVNCRH
ncbi:uncharacterized protein LOC108622253 isoform X2 [Ceratina calcarata]|uniref:Uncharacterized protein LOC108622253 isoform X2 n=1 Tax=Ceratina calcarata TaxID=156304 RepID=A0AAJ7IRM6_9HYME|nr:uncharacterized protein LOC108622253 isoform X2 [Ceratina calcarata]